MSKYAPSSRAQAGVVWLWARRSDVLHRRGLGFVRPCCIAGENVRVVDVDFQRAVEGRIWTGLAGLRRDEDIVRAPRIGMVAETDFEAHAGESARAVIAECVVSDDRAVFPVSLGRAYPQGYYLSRIDVAALAVQTRQFFLRAAPPEGLRSMT